MNMDSHNPFAAPTTLPTAIDEFGKDRLARRLTRLVAAIVDGFVLMAILLPIQYMTGFLERSLDGEPLSIIENLMMTALGIGIMLMINGYLLYTRGQSVGKLVTGIQIIDHNTGNLLPFFRVYVLRYLWVLPFTLVAIFIPGTMDDLVVSWINIIDVLFIFSVSRRCLHDYIAGSIVVEFRENRQRLGEATV